MDGTTAFADFLFEGGENVEVVEMSDSKSDFLSRVGLHKSCRQNTLLFRAMMDEARAGRERLFSSRECLVPDAADDFSIQAPYLPEHISEVAFSSELRAIFHHASDETREIYNTIRSPFPELDLWIVRWTLARAIEGKDDDESESGCSRRIHLRASEGDSADCASIEPGLRPTSSGQTALASATTPAHQFTPTAPSRPHLPRPVITSLGLVSADAKTCSSKRSTPLVIRAPVSSAIISGSSTRHNSQATVHTTLDKLGCSGASPLVSNRSMASTGLPAYEDCTGSRLRQSIIIGIETSRQKRQSRPQRRRHDHGQQPRVNKRTASNTTHTSIGSSLVSKVTATFLSKRKGERRMCTGCTPNSSTPGPLLSESMIAQARRGYWTHVLGV